MTGQPLALGAKLVGQFHYVLKGDNGEVIDRSTTQPMTYLHGAHNIIPGLEKHMEGKVVGDTFTAVIEPEEAYGTYDPNAVESVHKRDFPKDMELVVGRPVHARGSDGKPMTLWITKVQGARVELTSNHPLAGQTLHFEVQVVDIRKASDEEIAHGHAHGPGGHHH